MIIFQDAPISESGDVENAKFNGMISFLVWVEG
jgi:hypothetical protein